jgi:hypothetical protein
MTALATFVQRSVSIHRRRPLASACLLALLWPLNGTAQTTGTGPALATDQAAYTNYANVAITGTGFTAGETVSNIVVQTSGPTPGQAYTYWETVADANGNISTSWYIFSTALGGAAFQVIATGESSAFTAQTSFADSDTPSGPTVTTDRQDYPPFSTVDITGTGFQPGETVSNQIVQIVGPAVGTAYAPWEAVADTNGGFVTTWYVFTDELLNTTLQLTSTGESSVLTAQTTFTDSTTATISVGAQSGTPTYGTVGTATYQVTVTGSGSGGITVVFTTNGLPSGASAAFNPTSVTVNNGGNATSTLTVTTATSTPASNALVFSVGSSGSGKVNNGNGTLTVSPKALTMSGLSVPATKVYNGTTGATVSGTPTLQASEAFGTGSASDGKPYTGDSVSISGTATGTYNSKDVASATSVTFGGLSLTGAQATNYALTMQSAASATITAKALTMSGLSVPASRIYDATTTATVSGTPALQTAETAGTGTTADGKPYSGDTVSIIGAASGTYNSKDVATASSVSFSGLALGSAQSGDYTLTIESAASATITPKALRTVACRRRRARSMTQQRPRQ